MPVSPALPEHAEAIHAIQITAFKQEVAIYDMETAPPLEETIEDIRTFLTKHTGYVYLDEAGKVLGSVRISPRDDGCRWVQRLSVDPAHQRQGIAKALMKHLESWEKEGEELKLDTGHKSTKALGFYQDLGYNITSRERVDDKLTLVRLSKTVRHNSQ